MPDKLSYQFCSESPGARLAEEMRRIALEAAAPVAPGEIVKAQLNRSFEALRSVPGLSPLKFWRVRAAWYGEAGGFSGIAADDFRLRATQLQMRRETAREQVRWIGEVCADAAERLGDSDQELLRGRADRLRSQARELGARPRPRDET